MSTVSSVPSAGSTVLCHPPANWLVPIPQTFKKMAASLLNDAPDAARNALKSRGDAFPSTLSLELSPSHYYGDTGYFGGFYGEHYQMLGRGWICKETASGIFLAEPPLLHFEHHGMVLPGVIAQETVNQGIASLFMSVFGQNQFRPLLRDNNNKPQAPLHAQLFYHEGELLRQEEQRPFVAVTLVEVHPPEGRRQFFNILGVGALFAPTGDGAFKSHSEHVVRGTGHLTETRSNGSS